MKDRRCPVLLLGPARLIELLFCGGLAPDLHFDVMVQVVGCVSVAVQADVASFYAFGVDEFSGVHFDPLFVFSNTEFCGVVVIVVEDGGNTGLELFVVGHLNNRVDINAFLLVVVPDYDRVDFVHGFEVDLNVL